MTQKVTYKDAGVDLDIYAKSMSRLPKLAAGTFTSRVMRLDGGFAGLFRLQQDGKKYDDPVLVSCTDGVGTKLKLACAAGKHNTVGIDLVAMSVNDAICCGAEPLFFLDYVAMPKDDPDLLEAIVAGIADGCKQSGAALIGGETAIMPDIYRAGEYDLAGFCVGVAERSKIIDGKLIQIGDRLIGVASSGLHSNGFSLARRVVGLAGIKGADMVPELGRTAFDAMLEPTRIYVKPILTILNEFVANDGIRGIAHITGGGLEENVNRILPTGTRLQITPDSWIVPSIFHWLQKLGNIDDHEMSRVFNMGIGLVLVAKPKSFDAIRQSLDTMSLENFDLGRIVEK
ncbi:MAG: phosphoribosylformylglycinamidine cyclo-ligase [Planctomycetaceae bacterium]|jgi:phosphoribosylformylglycinamidine cyclo-ligase|nr:phosphoribosylformylglycinamidine cyclo-ligase [Planctomycetaceae bacterium]